MKFSHSLQFNAVPEWSSKYINYSGLKKICYALQREYAEELSNKTSNEVLQFTEDRSSSLPMLANLLSIPIVKPLVFFQFDMAGGMYHFF